MISLPIFGQFLRSHVEFAYLSYENPCIELLYIKFLNFLATYIYIAWGPHMTLLF